MKIKLCAGHGYNTPGKRVPDGSMREFEFNSAVANYAKSLLESYENVQVSFAHDPTGKTDVSLSSRVNEANKEKVDAYVSIHANAYGTGFNSADGIETYVYTSKPKEALSLANKVQNELIKQTGRSNRGVKTANFYVLKNTHMTAILCECGFMTNKEEAGLLKSDSYRRKCAESIVKGLVDQYNLKKKAVVKKPSEPSKTGSLYKVQCGAFSDKGNAEKLAAQLKAKGFKTYIVKE